MSATPALTDALRRQVSALEDDLRARAGQPQTDAAWRAEHAHALSAGRTGTTYVEWRDDRVTQAAVAWVLVSVFVRFCEDNGLVRPVWVSGPGARRQEALDAQAAFFRAHPDETDREWLLQAVAYLRGLPATAGLVDEHAALWLLAPSGDAVSALLRFWRATDDGGAPVWDLADPEWDSRFLGDLYQELSDSAKKTYALLQTPVFVEEFILDRTLEPALAERPLEGFRLIDPTCGSGHFLLGAFARLLDRWHRTAPALDARERVQTALDAIHGVDLNPYAVAIARFRLTLAALKASGLARLEDAPGFRYHLAVGDSLLHGASQQALDLGPEYDVDAGLSEFGYETEDLALLREILQPGRYDCVVGNPPYITVKDKALNQAYRERYVTCSGKYQLTVPFLERFFSLAKAGEQAGWVGQITSNGFMKRKFGTKLIEDFLNRQDLRLVADTSGAYIPGHGTPTVIIVGRHHAPVGSQVRAVLGVRGEPGRPDDAAKGLVWTSIVEHVDDPGWNDEWVTAADLDRSLLATHPWSLAGGVALDVSSAIDRQDRRLGTAARRIGFFGITGFDELALQQHRFFQAQGLSGAAHRRYIAGEGIRDWGARSDADVWYPYIGSELLTPHQAGADRYLWPYRTTLGARRTFSGGTYVSDGRPWWEWHQLPTDRGLAPEQLVFSQIATHWHASLLSSSTALGGASMLIKLAEGASEDEHLALLGVLNSSTACFWLKQNSHDKGSQGINEGVKAEAWERFYEFTGTTLQDFPLPSVLPLARGRLMDGLARRLSASTPSAVVESSVPSRAGLDAARAEYDGVRGRMVGVQEELDWECYQRYSLVDEDLTYSDDDLPGLALGERAFEIVLARRVAEGNEQTAWFERHGSTPVTDVPAHWPAAYRALVERRVARIESHPYLRLLERPEYKRRWAAEPWEKQEERALRSWLLDRLEDRALWFDGQGRPWARSVAQLADDVARDADVVSVLALWEGRPDVPVTESLVRLLDGEAVPFLAAYRYKEPGLRKRAAWEETWALQRREDAGERVGPIPVPPKYTSADFAKTAYWSHRGKLDVPKERFVLYPAAGRATDPTPVLGWAGWDHAEQALALARLVQEREADGWDDERLVPLLAGLAELQPWLDQWHHAPEPPLFAATSPADYFREQLTRRAQQAGRTLEQLAAWRPAPSTRGRPKKGA